MINKKRVIQFQVLPNPAPSWLSSKAWQEILTLKDFAKFQRFVATFAQNIDHYKKIFESQDPHRHACSCFLSVNMNVIDNIFFADIRCLKNLTKALICSIK